MNNGNKDEAMEEIKLSDDLKKWRAERPDEWTMDRFIRAAEKLERATIHNSEYMQCKHKSCDCEYVYVSSTGFIGWRCKKCGAVLS